VFLLTTPDSGRTALIDARSGVRLSYSELAANVRTAAPDLATGRKELIFVIASRDISTVVAYLAGIEADHAVALIDPSVPGEAFDRLLTTYRPDLVVFGSRDDDRPAAGRGYHHHDHPTLGRLWRTRAPAETPSIHPELACLLSTSGSTGSRKLVRLGRSALTSSAGSIARSQAISADDVAITLPPIAHAFGLGVLNSHLATGATVVLTESTILQDDFWRAVRGWHVTSLAGVPLTFELLHRLGPARIVPDAVTTLLQSGGRLDPDHVRFFYDFMGDRGGSFRVSYGQTETTARMSVWPHPMPRDKIGSVGRVIPEGQMRIDPATSEIWYRGPNVMMGYARTREDLARPGEVGELATGDLGYVDGDGFVFLTGRTRRIAKLAGLRVNLDEVEAMLHERAAAVEIGGRLGVYVEAAGPLDLEEMAVSLSGALGLDRGLLHVIRIDTLPRSSAGKVLYSRLEEQATRRGEA
jgi:acyl-CoA synthetase (AMP-forming)/AMP-acid ligase II